MRDDGTAAWVRSSIRYSVAESASSRPGSAVVLARLSEVLFAEAIRHYMDGLPPGQSGWLAGLRDRYVGRALLLLHEQPAHPWTVEQLARKVGMSRSALGQRFNVMIGKPPMQYLTRWRTSLAASRLCESNASISHVATEVGYESEAAFNRAFKREFGLPPAAGGSGQRAAAKRPSGRIAARSFGDAGAGAAHFSCGTSLSLGNPSLIRNRSPDSSRHHRFAASGKSGPHRKSTIRCSCLPVPYRISWVRRAQDRARRYHEVEFCECAGVRA